MYYADLGPNEMPILESYDGVDPLVRVPEPTQEMWDRFYSVLLDIRVKDWKKEYMNHHILDGGGWSLRVRFRNINRAGSGVNENPEEFVNAAGLVSASTVDGVHLDSDANYQLAQALLPKVTALLK